jgi:hypothetical protein
MWVAVCDNCKNPNVLFGKIDDDKNIWGWGIGHGYIQQSTWHACSRACAEHLDDLKKQGIDNKTKTA